jgi:rRNA-processing protein CGR1
LETVKAKEKELKDEKEAQRQVWRIHWATYLGHITDWSTQRWIQGIKDKRTAKAEKERYERLAEKMHRKRVERLKRREKRNKMIKSGKWRGIRGL